ncbi:RING finger protein 223-like [Zootoca vivipara]|uniref:RING finger protein 223-like n=1 Tax=Zootoca vivipara TaxID=8524 RepID=UPI00293BF562|nr:RING finger protein 223-like [Zootoca vivipara]
MEVLDSLESGSRSSQGQAEAMDPSPTAASRTVEEGASAAECPICYLSFDDVFRAPRLLPCSHTFCLECLARLCVFLKPSQRFQCPLCRGSVPLPYGGVPRLPVNMDIIQQFPPWMREVQEVWLDGFHLCWRRKLPGNAKEEEAFAVLVTVELLKAAAPRGSDPRELVVVHPVSRCWETCCLLWDHYPGLFCAAALMVLGVLLSTALMFGLQR